MAGWEVSVSATKTKTESEQLAELRERLKALVKREARKLGRVKKEARRG